MMGSPAQPLLDLRDKLYKGLEWVSERDKPIGQKTDTSWHDEMVKEANKSFSDGKKKLSSEGPRLGGKKKIKRSTRKPVGRKKVQ